METIIFEIMASISMAFVWVEILQIPFRFQRKLNFKPFNCSVCLSGWFMLGFTIIDNIQYHNIFEILGLMSIAMVLEIFLSGLIRKV
jgi:hypothetical protein